MYVPEYYVVDLEHEHELIERYPFALMVTTVAGELQGVHIPFVLRRDQGAHGTLSAHLARRNPIASVLPEAPDVMIAFTGPHAYITADDYPTGEPFPTWSYAVVHAYGRARPFTDDELRVQLRALIAQQEETMRPKPPWTLDRASPAAFEGYFREIVGFEVEITRIEGLFKLHQRNRVVDAKGQAAALRRRGADPCGELADLIERHNRHREE